MKRNNRRPANRRAQKKFKLPTAKKRVVRNLQPVIETKKFLGWTSGKIPGPVSHALPTTSAGLVIIPDAFMNMIAENQSLVTQGASVSGNDIFSRYLTTKILCEYPVNAHAPIDMQVRPVTVIWGWCIPLNNTATTPHVVDAITRAEIVAHVNQQIGEDFNSDTDSMLFIDKRKRSYNIIGRKKLKPNNNSSIIQTMNQGALLSHTMGGPPPVRTSISWPMNKKVEYTASKDTLGVPVAPFVYPNQAYVPFMVFYNPDYSAYVADSPSARTQINVSTNSCHWFNDA